jgi:hypothetical protein
MAEHFFARSRSGCWVNDNDKTIPAAFSFEAEAGVCFGDMTIKVKV